MVLHICMKLSGLKMEALCISVSVERKVTHAILHVRWAVIVYYLCHLRLQYNMHIIMQVWGSFSLRALWGISLQEGVVKEFVVWYT